MTALTLSPVTGAFIKAGAKAQLSILVAMTLETQSLVKANAKFDFADYAKCVVQFGYHEPKSVANILTVVRKLQANKTPIIEQYTFDKANVAALANYITDACKAGEYRLTLDDIGAWCTGALSFKAKETAKAQAKVAAEVEAARIRAAKEKEKEGYVVTPTADAPSAPAATVPDTAPMLINATLSSAPAAPDGAVPDTVVADFPAPATEAVELDHEVIHLTAPRAEQGESMAQDTSDAASEEARILRMVREASTLSDEGLDMLVNSLMEIMDARLQVGKELMAA